MTPPEARAPQPDPRWIQIGVTQSLLEELGVWMDRDPGCIGKQGLYFHLAGSLLRFTWFDYLLVSPAFFHSVVGLEGVIREVYQADVRETFRDLLARAVADRAISDTAFSEVVEVPEIFRDRIDKGCAGNAMQFASLLPKLRNDYLHGGFVLSPAFLIFAIQVREAADAIWNHFSTAPQILPPPPSIPEVVRGRLLGRPRRFPRQVTCPNLTP